MSLNNIGNGDCYAPINLTNKPEEVTRQNLIQCAFRKERPPRKPEEMIYQIEKWKAELKDRGMAYIRIDESEANELIYFLRCLQNSELSLKMLKKDFEACERQLNFIIEG